MQQNALQNEKINNISALENNIKEKAEKITADFSRPIDENKVET